MRCMFALVLVVVSLSQPAAQTPAIACAPFAARALPNTTIADAPEVTSRSFTLPARTNTVPNLPPFCRVAGSISIRASRTEESQAHRLDAASIPRCLDAAPRQDCRHHPTTDCLCCGRGGDAPDRRCSQAADRMLPASSPSARHPQRNANTARRRDRSSSPRMPIPSAVRTQEEAARQQRRSSRFPERAADKWGTEMLKDGDGSRRDEYVGNGGEEHERRRQACNRPIDALVDCHGATPLMVRRRQPAS